MTELSSDEDHALEAIKKGHFNKADRGANESQMTETQELSIHESMQKMHELNLEQLDVGADNNSLMNPEFANQNNSHLVQQAPKIDEKIVQQTIDQFLTASLEPVDPLPTHNRDANPFSPPASKHGGYSFMANA